MLPADDPALPADAAPGLPRQPRPAGSLRDRLGHLLNQPIILLAKLLALAYLFVMPLSGRLVLLVAVAWLSLWLRHVAWRDIGLRRPASWPRTIALGAAAGVSWQALSIGLLVPALNALFGARLDLTDFIALRGSPGAFALALIVAWMLGAFVEEFVFRGYLLNRVADLGRRTRLGWAAGLLVTSGLFGIAHLYQGPSGVIENFVFGLVLGGLYLAGCRSLWRPIVMHGVSNTIGLALIYLGLYP
jgi:uncharacterized protein